MHEKPQTLLKSSRRNIILKDSNPVTEKNSSGNQEVFNHYFKTKSIYVLQHRITKERNTHESGMFSFLGNDFAQIFLRLWALSNTNLETL